MKINEILQALRSGKKIRALDVVLIELNTFYEINLATFNMGLLYIATLLKQRGFKVKCLGVGDLYFTSLAEIEKFFKTTSPALVGFYTISDNIHQVKDMATRIKAWLPETVVVVGGPLATVEGEKMLYDAPYDIVGLGEGEEIMLKLAEYYLHGQGSLGEIEGIIYKRQEQSALSNQQSPVTIKKNPGFGWVEDLDALPFPDYDLIGMKKVFFVVSGRGCPYNCAFCFQGVHGKKYRYRSASKVVEEVIANLEKYQVKAFGFIDDTFVANLKRIKEIVEPLRSYREQKHKDFIFFCEARVDILAKHPELLPLLKEAGLARLQVGIESGNQKILDLFNKKIDLEQIESSVKQVAALGNISMHSNFILGGPETEAEFNLSLELAKRLLHLAPGWFECAAGFLCPYPGTKIALNLKDFGVELLDPDFKTGITVRDCFHSSKFADYYTLWHWSGDFIKAVNEEMRKLAPHLPYATLAKHFEWAQYGMVTNWHQILFNSSALLKDYFAFKQSPRFKRLEEVPAADLSNFRPLRVLKTREYDDQGRIVITAAYTPLILTEPLDLFIYEHSAGKLTLAELAALAQERFGGEAESLLQSKILPFFKKMEENYLMVFYL
jgi:anaerobic magnesium-protoporphyrin IX monomethyl ester cyclase